MELVVEMSQPSVVADSKSQLAQANGLLVPPQLSSVPETLHCVTHVPPEQTAFSLGGAVPHAVPTATAVPVSLQVGTPPLQDRVPS